MNSGTLQESKKVYSFLNISNVKARKDIEQLIVQMPEG